MCPYGVEFKKLGDLGVFENTGVDKKSHDDEQEVTLLNFMDVCRHKYIDASIPSMVVTAPDRKIEQCNVLKDDIFITPSSETIDEIGFAAVIMEDLPNVVYSYHIMRYRLNYPNTTTAKFIRYLFEAPVIRKQILKGAKGLTRFGLSKYQFADIEIPIPPLEIQKKIVECLDKFSALAAELQAELQMRRKQYEYYRTRLLTPHSESNSATKSDDAQWVSTSLGEICPILRGKRLTKSELSEDEKYPVFHGGIEPLGYYKEHNREANTVMIINVGASAGTVGYCDQDFWSSDGCFCLGKSDRVIPKFLYYLLQTREPELKSRVRYAGIPTLDGDVIKRLQVSFPSLKEQARIVEILDKFEKLITSMEEGIPAEQVAQQKRYEYYRDLLLTFDRKAE